MSFRWAYVRPGAADAHLDYVLFSTEPTHLVNDLTYLLELNPSLPLLVSSLHPGEFVWERLDEPQPQCKPLHRFHVGTNSSTCARAPSQ